MGGRTQTSLSARGVSSLSTAPGCSFADAASQARTAGQLLRRAKALMSNVNSEGADLTIVIQRLT